MKQFRLFGVFVAIVVASVGFFLATQHYLLLKSKPSDSALGNITNLLDLPQSVAPTSNSSSYCRKECHWFQDKRTHQFLESNHDPSSYLEHTLLSTEQ